MANAVQRFFQRLIGVEPRPNLNGKLVIKSYRNTKNGHKLEPRDLVLFDTPKGTMIATYQGGDANEASNYSDPTLIQHST